jgi:WD40 repeat protein
LAFSRDGQITTSLRHQDAIFEAAFSPNGKTVLTGGLHNTARLWSATTVRSLGPALQHASLVWAVGFGPDSNTALTASWDRTVRLWNVPKGMVGQPARICAWPEVLTGTELDDQESVRVLNAEAWQERRISLNPVGGPGAVNSAE